MARGNFPLLAMNRGEISPLALARIDVERTRLSAETMINWLPKTTGPMMIRPGLEYLGINTRSNDRVQYIDFVAATDDTALIEVSDFGLRVIVDDALVTRAAVSTVITNSTFTSSAGWTDASESGGTLAFGTIGGAQLQLNATNVGGIARVRRAVTVALADQGVEHALTIVVARGPVTFRCGTVAGDDSYIATTTLRTGRYSLSFTPAGDFVIEFETTEQCNRYVASCAIASAGFMFIVAPWAEADLDHLQWTQSGDVVFVACAGHRQYRIERRAVTSWGICDYRFDKGPFAGKTADIRLKAASQVGTTTLTADRPFFTAGHVGALFRLFHEGQVGTWQLGREDTYTDPIRVSGVVGTNYNDRDWEYVISGTWAGTLRVQRSFDGPDIGFQDYPSDQSVGATIDITGNTSAVNEDEDDNAIVWYRIGFQPGTYTSGTAQVDLDYDGGGNYGIVRVLEWVSATVVNVEVLKRLWSAEYTTDWSEGSWSGQQSWPTAVALHEGRLFWFGGAQIFGSVSDDYENFDQEFEGGAGPIIRTLGEGPVDSVNFALSLQRLLIGTAGAEYAVRSSSLDEPLSPSNLTVKAISTQGSKALFRAIKVDARGVYAQRSGKRLFEFVFDAQSYDYRSADLTLLHPDILSAGVVSVAVQRQPDTRIHIALGDGTAAILTYEPEEEVFCWSRVETAGFVERVVALPGQNEDQVYYQVRRVFADLGGTVRYLEKWALESQVGGGSVCRLADSFVVGVNSPASAEIAVPHLAGAEVVVWADGADLSPDDGDGVQATWTADGSGTVTLDAPVSLWMAGLPYEARWKSTKLAYAAAAGTALTQVKRQAYLGLILGPTHHLGLKYGAGFDRLDDIPQIHEGAVVAAGTVFDSYDAPAFELDGTYNTDSRLCLRARAPRPVTVLAAIVGITTHDKA